MGEELGIWWEMVHLSPVHCEDFEKDWMYFILLRRIRLPPNITENFVVKRLCAPQGFIKSPSTRLLPNTTRGLPVPTCHQPLRLRAPLYTDVSLFWGSLSTCQPTLVNKEAAIAATPSSLERMMGVAIMHNFVLVRHTLRTLYLTVRSHVFQTVP